MKDPGSNPGRVWQGAKNSTSDSPGLVEIALELVRNSMP